MKPFLFMALITVALLPVREQAQSLDEVIAKNIQARGGLENFRAIKTLRVTARFSQGGFRATYVQENKREDKIREELILQGMAQVQAYDGHTGWEIDPFRGRKDANLMSQDDLRALILEADLEGPLVDYKQKGHTAELIGHDSVEGTDCYKIKLTMKNGDVRYYYLDVDSYLEIKFQTQSKVRGAVQYNDTILGDYEQVEGVYFPFSVETTETGSDNWARFTVEKIEVNVPLEDTRFSLPAPKAEAKPSSRPSEPHLADLSGGKNRSGGNFCERNENCGTEYVTSCDRAVRRSAGRRNVFLGAGNACARAEIRFRYDLGPGCP